jgi:hypothetical protein
MYFLNSQRTLCHMIEDMRTGKAPDPCGSKAPKFDIIRYLEGKPNHLLQVKPSDIPLCKHCEKAIAWARAL